ncbi:MAG TPA: molybdenum cofactor biosynthesis protein B [Patescibacteria group bacterium]|nr:molybdenum cofactor biosynthesis protein B [Patescibacteria group bacterium]
MSHRQHRRSGPVSVTCAVVTVSDTRTVANDRSGRLIRAALERDGHAVVDDGIVKDDPRRLRTHLAAIRRRGMARVVVMTGGTGVAPRDRTFEAVEALFEKRLPGFGELFRMLSYRQVGSAAMLSRATAGLWRGMVVFSLPGSPRAVRLAMRRLILPELRHVAGLLGPARGRRA